MLIFVLLTTMFTAAEFTAADLKQYCASDVLTQQMYCVGYLKGLIDGVSFTIQFSRTLAVGPAAAVGLTKQDSERIVGCIPAGVAIEQARLVFLKYVENIRKNCICLPCSS